MFSGVLRNENDIDHDTTEAFVDQVRPPLLERGTALLLCQIMLKSCKLAEAQCKLASETRLSAGVRHVLQGNMLERLEQVTHSCCLPADDRFCKL